MRGACPDQQRRQWLGRTAAAFGACAGAPWSALAAGVSSSAPTSATAAPLRTRPVPSSGEALPLVGLGSWITFNVGNDPQARARCTQVIGAFFDGGGRMIDSSPMYGSSQPVIGHALARLGRPAALVSAVKVWTGNASNGATQMEASRAYWGVQRFDLMQVHNLLAWQAHLPLLTEMKAAGSLRYVGITTSHGRRHDELLKVMRKEPLDFVQVTYNLRDRAVEERILPLAQERGIAVIVNRPFQGGALVDELMRHPLPPWAAEIDCDSWARVALKFVVSHPAVTCAIPATRQVAHVRQNLGAARGRLPDAALRQRIASAVAGF